MTLVFTLISALVWATDPSTQVASGWSMKKLNRCERAFRNTPPLWVVPTGFDSNTGKSRDSNRNYRQGEMPSSESPLFVPKRSIVQLHPETQSRLEKSATSLRDADFVRVRVLSVPPLNSELLKSDSGGVKSVARPRTGQLAQPGDDGFLRYRDLERAPNQKNYVFAVKQESPLYRFLISRDLETNAFALKFLQENDKYVVNSCCGTVSHPEKEEQVQICRDFPIFEILDGKTGDKLKNVTPLEVDCESCYLNGLVAMNADFLAPIQNLIQAISHDNTLSSINSFSHIRFVDSRGYIQIPVSSDSAEPSQRQGPFGSLHYKAEKGEADLYMRPESACGFMRVLQTWKEKHCPNGEASCQVRFGNASHAYYNSSIAKGAGFWPHYSHDSGECIDIVPIYQNGCSGGCSFKSRSFSRDKMQSLLDLMIAAGADNCFLTHNGLIRNSKGVCSYDSQHDDHLHICFPVRKGTSSNDKLMQACQRGLK